MEREKKFQNEKKGVITCTRGGFLPVQQMAPLVRLYCSGILKNHYSLLPGHMSPSITHQQFLHWLKAVQLLQHLQPSFFMDSVLPVPAMKTCGGAR